MYNVKYVFVTMCLLSLLFIWRPGFEATSHSTIFCGRTCGIEDTDDVLPAKDCPHWPLRNYVFE